MLAELRPALIITRREVRDQFRDWRIILPIVVLTIFFPWLMNFTAAQAVNFVQRYDANIVGERLIPFLLMVVGFFPISISLVIALESFVGEKERRSIEPLLSTPLDDRQLYLGKLLASMAPPLVAAYLGILVYVIGVYNQIGYFPGVPLLIQILLLTAVQAVVMVSGAVVISTQTTSARAANLLASFIIIPMALLIQGESIIMFWGNYSVLWWLILALLLVAGLLIRMGISHFNREELLGHELDTLNVRWMAATLRDRFRGPQDTTRKWLADFYRGFFHQLGLPMLFVTLVLGGGLLVGVILSHRFALPVRALNIENLDTGSVQGFEALPLYSVGGVVTIWLHNLRSLLLATLVSTLTFSVLGMLVIMLPMAIIGYFMASMSAIGL
jgi:ABC-type transport system involved in multi-copper enzyme maturation permease subunit